MTDLRENNDPLVKKITESFLAYRNSMRDYQVYASAGEMNARAMDYNYG
jgi:hypothetical protein